MGPPPRFITDKDEPGQTYLVEPPKEPIPTPTATADRRQATSTMISELLANCDVSFQMLAEKFGVTVPTIEKWRIGASAPISANFQNVWRVWNYLMAQAQKQKRKIHHPTKGA